MEETVRRSGKSEKEGSADRLPSFLPVPSETRVPPCAGMAGERAESLRSTYSTEVLHSLMNGVFSVTDRPVVLMD